MNVTFENWVEMWPDYWINKDSNWVVRDYFSKEGEEGWVILNDKAMMISSSYKKTKEECMIEVEYILQEDSNKPC
jgi:hypothetical protein